MSVLRKKPFVEELLEALTTDEIVRLSSIINVKGEPEVVDLGLTGNNPLPSSAPASIEDRIKLINLVLSPSSVYTGILIYHSTSYCAFIGTVAFENDIIKLFKLNVASRKAEPINEKLTADELRRVLDDTMESKGAGGDKVQVGDILSDDEAAGKVIASDGEGGAEWEKVANLLPGSDVESGSVASMLGFNEDGNLVKGSVPAGSVVDATLDGESENPVQNKAIVGGIAVVAHDIASDYDSTATYGVGDYALYENVLYKCKSANTTGSWDATKWDEVTVGNELENIKEDLEDYAKVDGNYPTMTVGAADSLTPFGEESGAEDTTPFVFQSAGGESDIGSQAYLRALRGNSVAWNQLTINGNFVNTNYFNSARGDCSVDNNVGIVTITQGWTGINSVAVRTGMRDSLLNHKYLVTYKVKTSVAGVFGISTGFGTSDAAVTNVINTWVNVIQIVNCSSPASSNNVYYRFNPSVSVEIGDIFYFKETMVFDLTQMFGAGNEPTTVAEFIRMFPQPYYEYNAGELLSCKVNGYKTVGYNAFDGEWLQGKTVDDQTGSIVNDNRCQLSKNYIKVIPGQTYSFELQGDISGWVASSQRQIAEYDSDFNFIKYTFRANSIIGFSSPWKITLTNNTKYILIGMYNGNTARPNNNFAFHLIWDGSRTGYEPYESHTYPMPNVELRSAGSAYDEITPDGTLIRRIGVVDLGSLDYVKLTDQANNSFISGGAPSNCKPAISNAAVANIACSKYRASSKGAVQYLINDKTIAISSSGVVIIQDSSYTNATASEFKSAMSGVYLFYELATPTEESVDSYQELTPIDDFGTQEFLYDNNITIPVPQGNEFFYPVDYKAFIDSLGGREDVEYAASALVSQTQLTQALASFLSSIPGYDATKSQTLKNNQGTIIWEDNE